jgi:hypothetical protein
VVWLVAGGTGSSGASSSAFCGGVSSLVMWEARLEDRYEYCLQHKYDIPLAEEPG